MRNIVLIVDDVEVNRDILAMILEEEYPIIEAENGRVAVELMEKHQDEIAVVLLDLIMPEYDGYAVLETMNERNWINIMPVLVISAEAKGEVEQRCLDLGVSDFIRKPFNAMLRKRVKNIVDLFLYRNQLEEKVEEQTITLKKQNKQLQEQAERLKESNTKIIDILGTVVESRNLESGEHIKRVKGFTRILAEQMQKDYPEYGLTDEKIEIIVSASSLHDIGKIAIPDSILLKPGRLTEEEFACMKTHTIRGDEVLDSIQGVWDEDYDKVSHEICRYHHERYDGRGYPDGLKGEEIPISAQLVGVADVYDALVSERVYKSAFSPDEAFEMIQGGKCGNFSPKILDGFRKVKADFEALNRLQNKPQEQKEM